MGSLTIPQSGLVYVDAPIAIYSVDKHPVYGPLYDPIWQGAQDGRIEVIGSELTLLETLVGPIRNADVELARRREGLWTFPNARLVPITQVCTARGGQISSGTPGPAHT